jgi:hypothetical protein
VMSQRESSASRLDELVRRHDWAEVGGGKPAPTGEDVEISPAAHFEGDVAMRALRWARQHEHRQREREDAV